MGKIPYKARAIYGKLPAMGVYTKYLPGGAFDLYGFWEIVLLHHRQLLHTHVHPFYME